MYKLVNIDNNGVGSFLVDNDSDMPYLPTDTTEGNPTYAYDVYSTQKVQVGSDALVKTGNVGLLFPSGWGML